MHCSAGFPVGTGLTCPRTHPETIGLKMRTGDPGVIGKRSPAVALFDLSSSTHRAPGCYCSHVPELLPTQLLLFQGMFGRYLRPQYNIKEH